ncbi:MBL fold metallo-hydrolase [Mucilaginibacter paludis]|uniref:Beta-lactamase domain-containing protein n=1 Tax=Mucilaginibacter paludis DSM 18603 TaxID=714943 RepID=H1Y4N8_9SPHI|nr:MBL fold metallo-hydrolase [Mucilaginibacter paludis]EHQ28082.1 beta-lactamase domain-containing protein [Mucilaginibacter paludis DSM 18603]
MLQIQAFPNNPYQENTYIVFDESGDCAIVDPGMYTASEQNIVVNFIKQHNLKPVLSLNTHCHIDHVFGNKFIFEQYGLKPQFHEGEVPVLVAVPSYAPQMGFRYDVSPMPDTFLPETGTITLGKGTLELIFAPGHSPAHLCFYAREENFLVGGDVLFRGSIGRTDLPGGDFKTLIDNIEQKLFTLPDDCIVYPGHGEETTIGFEKEHNPFFI